MRKGTAHFRREATASLMSAEKKRFAAEVDSVSPMQVKFSDRQSSRKKLEGVDNSERHMYSPMKEGRSVVENLKLVKVGG